MAFTGKGKSIQNEEAGRKGFFREPAGEPEKNCIKDGAKSQGKSCYEPYK